MTRCILRVAALVALVLLAPAAAANDEAPPSPPTEPAGEPTADPGCVSEPGSCQAGPKERLGLSGDPP